MSEFRGWDATHPNNMGFTLYMKWMEGLCESLGLDYDKIEEFEGYDYYDEVSEDEDEYGPPIGKLVPTLAIEKARYFDRHADYSARFGDSA